MRKKKMKILIYQFLIRLKLAVKLFTSFIRNGIKGLADVIADDIKNKINDPEEQGRLATIMALTFSVRLYSKIYNKSEEEIIKSINFLVFQTRGEPGEDEEKGPLLPFM